MGNQYTGIKKYMGTENNAAKQVEENRKKQ